MSNPALSIITAVHADGLWLPGKVAELNASDLADTEVIFVCDTGGDEARALDAHCETNPAFRAVHVAPCTLYGAWNQGIAVARGEFLAYSNCDDSFAPNWPQEIVRFMRETGLDAAHTLTYFAYPDKGARRSRCKMPGPNCCWRSSLPTRFDASLRIAGDLAFYQDLALSGYEVGVMPAPAYLMRVHGGNLSMSGDAPAVIREEVESLGNAGWPAALVLEIAEAHALVRAHDVYPTHPYIGKLSLTP